MSFLQDNGFLPRIKSPSMRRPSIVSVLDVGTHKVCCLIAKLTPKSEGEAVLGRTHSVEILGIGHQQAHGVKSGVIVNLQQAERAIRLAVDGAERMAGITVESVICNVSSGRLVSEAFAADISLDGHAVENSDIAHVLAADAGHALAPDRSVVHSIPVGYSLDGEHGISNPLGMIGSRLGVNMHVLTAENAPLRNLELCINRAHLSVEAMIATPYAAGLSTLVEDEMQMGSACIDMGGGTTTLSVFMDGRFVYSDAIAIGGNHVTMDIARGLGTRVEDAESIKVKHGSVLVGTDDETATITVPPIAGDARDVPAQVSRSQIVRIIRPRVEETLELIRDRLANSGFSEVVGKRLVLTGGASQLNGMSEVAKRLLSRNVRIGRPMGVSRMPEAAKGPAFATSVGLLIYPQMAKIENVSNTSNFAPPLLTGTGGMFGKIGTWFKENF